MIDCVNVATAHLFGDALAAQHRLRYRVFIERQEWDVPHWQGLEYDQYDTPAAHYLIYRDEAGEARGVSRMSPTDRPYMLKDVWPDMVEAEELPSSSLVWEGTRIGIDRDLSPADRRRILGQLVCAYAEFGLSEGIEWIIGVMPTLIIRSLFQRSGWHVEMLGEPRVLGGDKVRAGKLRVDEETLHRARAYFGVEGPILRRADGRVGKAA
jgi:acyl homoserine lactone synthase